MAKAIGPKMERTIRKKVLSVSMSRAEAAKSSSKNSRTILRNDFLRLYTPRSTYIPAIVAISEGERPSSSNFLSNSSLLTK